MNDRENAVLTSALTDKKIYRSTWVTFRRTRCAEFRLSNGYYICDAWFEDGEPRLQIRSSAALLDGVSAIAYAAIITAGIQKAIEWLKDEIEQGGNVPKIEMEGD